MKIVKSIAEDLFPSVLKAPQAAPSPLLSPSSPRQAPSVGSVEREGPLLDPPLPSRERKVVEEERTLLPSPCQVTPPFPSYSFVPFSWYPLPSPWVVSWEDGMKVAWSPDEMDQSQLSRREDVLLRSDLSEHGELLLFFKARRLSAIAVSASKVSLVCT